MYTIWNTCWMYLYPSSGLKLGSCIQDFSHLCEGLLTLDCASQYIKGEDDEQVCGSDDVTYPNLYVTSTHLFAFSSGRDVYGCSWQIVLFITNYTVFIPCWLRKLIMIVNINKRQNNLLYIFCIILRMSMIQCIALLNVKEDVWG